MTAQQSIAVILLLTGLLASVSAVAGALWQRGRSQRSVAALAESIEARLRVIEARLEAWSSRATEREERTTEREFAQGFMTSAENAVRGPVTTQAVILKAPPLISVPDLAAPSAEPAPINPELAARFSSIWRLAEEGTPPESIARATGQPIGQVELILALRRHLEPGLVEAPV